MELHDRVADVLVRAVAEQLQLGAVRPQDGPIGRDPVERDRRVVDEVLELVARGELGRARAVTAHVAGTEHVIEGDGVFGSLLHRWPRPFAWRELGAYRAGP